MYHKLSLNNDLRNIKVQIEVANVKKKKKIKILLLRKDIVKKSK